MKFMTKDVTLVRWFTFAAAALLMATRVGATPLTLTETTDFSNTSPGSIVGVLDVGVNTVSGTVTCCTDPADYFQLSLPSSMTITEVRIDVSNFSAGTKSGSGVFSNSDGELEIAGLSIGSPVSTNVTSDTFLDAHGANLLTGPGTIGLGLVSPTLALVMGTGSVLTPAGFSYTATVTVEGTPTSAAVPEPASMLLLGTGLMGIGARRWRTRRQRS